MENKGKDTKNGMLQVREKENEKQQNIKVTENGAV